MTAEIESLVLEHLWAIRATQADHGERLKSIELHLKWKQPNPRGRVEPPGCRAKYARLLHSHCH